MADPSSKMYTGETLLRISIDLGAAFSAVAYHKLVKGQPVPAPQSIQTFVGAPNAADGKVPSSILYQDTTPIAYGFEAENHIDVNEPGFLLVRHFKLALHPDYMVKSAEKAIPESNEASALVKHGELFEKPVLPVGLEAGDVITHYLRWLISHTRDCFIKHHENGKALWEKLIVGAHFVLGAPNGWSAQQRQTLKNALKNTGHLRNVQNVTVISEGEASLHHILNLQSRPLSLQNNTVFLVCDAGGSTIDTTAYKCLDAYTVKLEEVGAADCLQRGGIYLSRKMKESVQDTFARLPFHYNTEDNVEAAMRNFEHDVKNQYTMDSEERRFLSFTYSKTPSSDRKLFVINGKLGIDGYKVKAAFEYSAGAIIARLLAKIEEAKTHGQVKSIVLVGGLGDSPYIHTRLSREFSKLNIEVIKAPYDMPGAKAVSIGASWYAMHSNAVVSRTAGFHYGYGICVPSSPFEALHNGKLTHLHACSPTAKLVANHFGPAITKGEASTPCQFRWHGLQTSNEKGPVKALRTSIFASTSAHLPYWTSKSDLCGATDYNEDILKLGEVSFPCPATFSVQRQNTKGHTYWDVNWELGVTFGGAEIVCQIRHAITKQMLGPEFVFEAVPA